MSSATVTQVSRNFAHFVNRVAYRRESFTLVRGRRPLAELRPLPFGASMVELPEVVAALPGLTVSEAEAFAADLAADDGRPEQATATAIQPPEWAEPANPEGRNGIGAGALADATGTADNEWSIARQSAVPGWEPATGFGAGFGAVPRAGVLMDAGVVLAARCGRLALGPRAAMWGRSEVFLSVVTAADLLRGVCCAVEPSSRARRAAFAEGVLERLPVLPVDLLCARAYARLRADLGLAAASFGSRDLWLAATCIAHGLPLVTAGARRFAQVPGLRVVVWAD